MARPRRWSVPLAHRRREFSRAERYVVDCVRDAGFQVEGLGFGLNLWTVLMEPGAAVNRLGGFLAGFAMACLLALPLMLLAVAWYRMGTGQLRELLSPSPRQLELGVAAGLGLVLLSASSTAWSWRG